MVQMVHVLLILYKYRHATGTQTDSEYAACQCWLGCGGLSLYCIESRETHWYTFCAEVRRTITIKKVEGL